MPQRRTSVPERRKLHTPRAKDFSTVEVGEVTGEAVSIRGFAATRPAGRGFALLDPQDAASPLFDPRDPASPLLDPLGQVTCFDRGDGNLGSARVPPSHSVSRAASDSSASRPSAPTS